MKNIYLIFLMLISMCHQTDIVAKERYIIGGRWAGLFSNFLGVINHLIWCEKENKDLVVHWQGHPHYYMVPQGYNGSKNIWEYYFLPVSESNYHRGDTIHYDYFSPDGEGINPHYLAYPKILSYEYRKFINSYFEKYIHIKENILNKIDDFYQKNIAGKKTVGIHIRRTDHNEGPRVPLELFIDTANQFEGYQFFVATDDQNVLDTLKKTLMGPVIYYDSFRSTNGAALHLGNPQVRNKALMGEQVLIEAKLLSMCDHFIHGISNVSLAALFFNPQLKNSYLKVYD